MTINLSLAHRTDVFRVWQLRDAAITNSAFGMVRTAGDDWTELYRKLTSSAGQSTDSDRHDKEF
jgi:hypothetical protein